MLMFHECEIFFDQCRRLPCKLFFVVFQGRALRAEKQQQQQVAMPMDERSVFVHHIFEVISVAHGHDVGSAPPVMLVQHILESAHGRSHDLDKDVVLARKVIVLLNPTPDLCAISRIGTFR